jgi:hypothetical protein
MNADALDLETLRAIGCVVAVGMLFLAWPRGRGEPVPTGDLDQEELEALERAEREAVARAIADQEARRPIARAHRAEIGLRVLADVRERERRAQRRAMLRRAAR